jgi:hypothetical protein
MAARWVGLSGPNKKTFARVEKRDFVRDCLHALGASSVLLMATAMNFALYPDALAAVVGGEQTIVGFVPTEPAASGPAPTVAAPVAVDEDEVRLLAATAWGEARSEGPDGMRAVAHVIVNRVGERFGESLETVIRAPKQFSAWNIGDPNRPLVQNPERYATRGENLATWLEAQDIAREVLSGRSVDPTNGALFYHTRAIRPWWSRYGHGATVIGAHIFYRDVPDGGRGERRRGRIRMTQIADNAPSARGPRAGRVNGVIQYASATAAHQPLPSEASDALPAPTTVSVPEPIATATLTSAPMDVVAGQ